jgi:TetR/AcrR family transcriptional repressor of nem operon
MPWPRDHKARTRRRIVQAAAAAFRERGIPEVGVDTVMEDAGLTRGGFYAHFASKDELVAEALDQANAETLALLDVPDERATPRHRLHAMVDAYLSDWHAAHAGRGCPIAALGPEVARAGGKGRRRLAVRLSERIEWMKSVLPAGGKSADARVVPMLACMVGGLILARAAGGDKGSEILASCRAFLYETIDRSH